MKNRTGNGFPQTYSDFFVRVPQNVSPTSLLKQPRGLWVLLFPIVVATLCLVAPFGSAQIAGSSQINVLTLHGKIRRPSGEWVRDALVTLQQNSTPITSTTTDASGRFEFVGLRAGTYTVSSEVRGDRGQVQVVVGRSSNSLDEVELVLKANPNSQSGSGGSPSDSIDRIELSDSPTFAVAGVTDWTAAGGHGSDSSLRTSEALVHETLSLKPGSLAANGRDSRKSSGSESETEIELRRAAAADPAGFETNYRLGDFLLKSGEFDDALPPLTTAYERKPDDLENEYDLAVACEEVGDLSKALQHVKSLLDRGDRAEWHSLAAEISEKLGDPLNAVREYERAALMVPSETNYFNWGSELLLHRAVWQAKEVFEKGVKAYPKSSRMLAALGAALFSGARYEEAALRLCQASDLDPSDPKPYEFMAKVEQASPSPLDCIPAKLDRFHQEQPANPLANYFYAMAIWKGREKDAGDPITKQVEGLLTKAVALDPKCADAFFQLGNLSASRLDYEKAIGFYKQSVGANAQLAEAHYRLAMAYDRVSQHDLAKQEFQLHDQIRKAQASEVEKERREVKQFLVVTPDSKARGDSPY